MSIMSTKCFISFLIVLILLNDASIVSASPPARIVAGIVTNVVSTVFKWLWSLRTPVIKPEKAISTRSMMKFEGGYRVETVFDGSKNGIEPYSIEVSPTGELLILDSANSNLYKTSSPLSRYSRPKLFAGSTEGYTGHVDGKLREARMYYPKGLTVDDRGNIYVADTMNMAIRKISESGITTIAGGKWSNGGAHMDGASEDAKFSDDFELTYVRSSCSLLVTDRVNQAILEIQLHDADCSYDKPVVKNEQQDENFVLGAAVIVAAVFSGYMLALLKQRAQALFSNKKDTRLHMNMNNHTLAVPYQRPPKSVRPPLIPPEEEDFEEEDEGLLFSFGKLIVNASSSVAEVFAGLLFSGFRKKKTRHQNLRHFQHMNGHPDHYWPVQNNYALRDEHDLPGLESRTAIMRTRSPQPPLRQGPTYYEAGDAEFPQQQPKVQQPEEVQKEMPQKKKQQPRNGESKPKTTAGGENGSEKSEIVFGAVQEQDGRREAMVIKAVDYSDPIYNQHSIRPRVNYMGYSSYSYT